MYLVHNGGRARTGLARMIITLAHRVKVEHPPVMRTINKGTINLGAFGKVPLRESHQTGRHDRRKVRVSVPDNRVGYIQTVATTADGVKTAIRRLREPEANILADIDLEIAELTERLRHARERRGAALLAAWQKAHVVRLNEVQAAIGDGLEGYLE